jgi:hypothetical protein
MLFTEMPSQNTTAVRDSGSGSRVFLEGAFGSWLVPWSSWLVVGASENTTAFEAAEERSISSFLVLGISFLGYLYIEKKNR